jgi:hypothetical protein
VNPIQYAFDVTNIDPYVGGNAPLPGGWYLVAITDMEVRENNGKTGHNLSCENTVQDGELKGRKFFDNLNLWHGSSSQAIEIAQKQLSSIGHAVGVLSGNDLTLLANKPFLVELELTAQEPDKLNPNTGETVKGRGPQNRVIQRKPATPENIALHLNGKPSNSGPAPQFIQQSQAAQAASAPAFNQAQSALSAPAQSAPPFNPAAQQQAATPAANQSQAQAVANGGPAIPPWQKG